jgi:hypothetical protein
MISIEIDKDNEDIAIIDGIRFSREFFEMFTSPLPGFLYRVIRLGDVCTVERIEEALCIRT